MSDELRPTAEPHCTCVCVRLDRPTQLLTIAEAREFARSLMEAARLAAEYEEPDSKASKVGRNGAAKRKVLRQQELFMEVVG